MLSADNALEKKLEFVGKAPHGSELWESSLDPMYACLDLVHVRCDSCALSPIRVGPGGKRSKVSKRRTFQSDFKLSEQETLVKRVIGLKQQSWIRTWCLTVKHFNKNDLFEEI